MTQFIIGMVLLWVTVFIGFWWATSNFKDTVVVMGLLTALCLGAFLIVSSL